MLVAIYLSMGEVSVVRLEQHVNQGLAVARQKIAREISTAEHVNVAHCISTRDLCNAEGAGSVYRL